MALKEDKNHNNVMKIVQIVFVVVFLAAVTLGTVAYIQSSNLKNQADQLVKNDQIAEAIILYDKAQAIFPFRLDIANDIQGARLVLQSSIDYSTISDIDYAEVQVAPPITSLPATKVLQPNEIFVPILMYHHIEVNPMPNDPLWASLYVTPLHLDSQLNFLTANGYTSISLDDLNNALHGSFTLPKNPIILTFDDGYESFYTNAYPLLKKYKIKATEFVITQVVSINKAYLTWNQISEMDKSGFIFFGGHTRHHPNLTNLTQAGIINEVQGSKSDLEAHLAKPTTWFAYPYGSYNDAVVQTVKDSGYVGAVSTIYGLGQSKEGEYLAPRIMVDGRYALSDFVARIQK